jgi:FkbM family methyltransferase
MKTLIALCFRRLNDLLRPFGLRLLRTTSPTRMFVDFFAHLVALNFDFKTVIDVGVARGTPQIYRSFPRAKYYLIEPVREFLPTLEKLERKLHAEYVLAAAGSKNGEITINVHNDLSGSTVFSQAEGDALVSTKRTVKRVRLDSILPSVMERPCLLKVDAQGSELEILEGLGGFVDQVDVIILETSLMAFRPEAPEFYDIVKALDKLDFAVYDILEGHVRALDGALAQVDLAFVRKNSVLRQDPRFFSAQQLDEYVAAWTPRERRKAASL